MSSDPHRDLERVHDDLAGYALGALDPDDAARLERHLESCDSCHERLLWLQPAIDVLPASIEQLAPPPGVRERLLATVEAEATAKATPDRTPATASRRSSWWSGLAGLVARPAVALAAVLALVAGAVGGYVLRGEDEVTAESTFVEAVPAQGATGVSVTLERHGDSGTLHVNQLPDLGRDEVYEVWVQRGGVMEPASTFILGRDGSADAAVPGPLAGAEGVFVTAEPRPGSPQPTSPPVLEAPLR